MSTEAVVAHACTLLPMQGWVVDGHTHIHTHIHTHTHKLTRTHGFSIKSKSDVRLELAPGCNAKWGQTFCGVWNAALTCSLWRLVLILKRHNCCVWCWSEPWRQHYHHVKSWSGSGVRGFCELWKSGSCFCSLLFVKFSLCTCALCECSIFYVRIFVASLW